VVEVQGRTTEDINSLRISETLIFEFDRISENNYTIPFKIEIFKGDDGIIRINLTIETGEYSYISIGELIYPPETSGEVILDKVSVILDIIKQGFPIEVIKAALGISLEGLNQAVWLRQRLDYPLTEDDKE